MTTLRIVEAFDVIEHVGSCLVSRPIRFARCSFGLERREEALHCGIVPDVAGSAHRTDDTVIGHQLLELLAALLSAAIEVVQQCIGFAPPPDRHHQSIRDELRRHRCAHRPTDHALREC